jgi:AcrR family transcriptional regulator
VTQGLIYHYFGSKEKLLFATVDTHGFLPEMRRILSASYQRAADEVLLEIGQLLQRFWPRKTIWCGASYGNPRSTRR